MLFNVWLQNPLKRGFIELKDKKIELKNITCSLLVGAGRSDQLVTADAAQPLSQLTSSQDVTFTLILADIWASCRVRQVHWSSGHN